MTHAPGAGDLRFPWSRSGRPVPRLIVRPLQVFLHTEAAGGLLLLLAAVAALVWANSSQSGSYESLWHTELAVGFGDWRLSADLRHWVNEALMALFFFVVGLEIKREVVSGELRDPRVAALPAVAAVGGMVVPALLYASLNFGGAGSKGWAIPMATDIAFALGVFSLAAPGLPSSIKVFLLSLAIVDDIGAIVVIALFYSANISWPALGVAAALVLSMFGLQRLQVRWVAVYVVLGVAAWVATYQSGVHATIAGVVLGLMTPAVPFQRPKAVTEEARRVADQTADEPDPPDADAHHWLWLADLSREAVSPLARLEAVLHPWTSFLIVPLFALANAGVKLSGSALTDAATSPVTLGVVLGLVLGKPLGISLAAWGATRLHIAKLPGDVTWKTLISASVVAGIGFTVSLFLSELAFAGEAAGEMAKVGILGGSLLAGLLGVVLLRVAVLEGPGRERRL